MKTIYTACAMMIALIMTGCATNFSNPISEKARLTNSGTPMIQITQQGSMPATMAYRTTWPIYVTVTNAQAKVIPPEVIIGAVEAAVGASTDVTKSYFSVLQSLERYRVDVVISGYSNLDTKAIQAILENSTRPQQDAQRPAFYNPNGQ